MQSKFKQQPENMLQSFHWQNWPKKEERRSKWETEFMPIKGKQKLSI